MNDHFYAVESDEVGYLFLEEGATHTHCKAKQTDNCCHSEGSHTMPMQHPSPSNDQTHDSGACALRDIKEKEDVRAKVVMEDAASSFAAATASEGSDPLE